MADPAIQQFSIKLTLTSSKDYRNDRNHRCRSLKEDEIAVGGALISLRVQSCGAINRARSEAGLRQTDLAVDYLSKGVVEKNTLPGRESRCLESQCYKVPAVLNMTTE